MKLQDLFEEKVTPEQQLIRWIKQNCPNNFSALMSGRALPLWRCTELTDVAIVDDYTCSLMIGRTAPRQSLTNNNLIMNYVSQAHDWADVPQRNTSTSCTPTPAEAKSFDGELCLIIPSDAVKVYASTPMDFNFTTPLSRSTDSIMEVMAYPLEVIRCGRRCRGSRPLKMSDTLTKLMNVIKLPIFDVMGGHTYSLEDIEALSDAIEKTIYLVDDMEDSDFKGSAGLKDLKYACTKFEENLGTRSFEEFLHEYITPKNLGVKLYRGYSSIKADRESEIWFNGNYVAITSDNDVEKLVSSPFLRKLFQKI